MLLDASSKTQVEVDGLGPLSLIDLLDETSKGLSAHFYELPAGFDRPHLKTSITFEDGRVEEAVLI
jgi:hypothetical protein